MRIGTWNLLHGISLDSGQVDPDLLAAEAASLECDILGIQEVDEFQARSGDVSQSADIAAAMGALDYRFLPAIEGYGICLISRKPVRQWHELRLPWSRRGMPLLVPNEKGPRLGYVPDEPRVAIAAELDGLTIATVHLSFVPGRNIRQLRVVRRWLDALPGPHLLIGDFNLPGKIPARVSGYEDLVRVPTYPAWNPKVQFDHILADSSLLAREWESPHLKVSDHRPLVVTLD